MVNESDHDLLIRHDALLGTVIAETKENAKASIARDTELKTKLEQTLSLVQDVATEVREMKTTDKIAHDSGLIVAERVETLWRERPSPEQLDQRLEFVRQHNSMWSAFTVAKVMGAIFLAEQSVIVSLAVWWFSRGGN